MSRVRIEFSQEELEAICRRRAVKRLALLGSVLRDDFGPDSDVAVLFCGRRVDLVDSSRLNPRLR